MSSSDLQLYSQYAEGMRYLLAQSLDTRDLVPEENEGNWEPIGKKKDVKVPFILCYPERLKCNQLDVSLIC